MPRSGFLLVYVCFFPQRGNPGHLSLPIEGARRGCHVVLQHNDYEAEGLSIEAAVFKSHPELTSRNKIPRGLLSKPSNNNFKRNEQGKQEKRNTQLAAAPGQKPTCLCSN